MDDWNSCYSSCATLWTSYIYQWWTIYTKNQVSKNKGTHVWFFTDDGKAKDSIIDYILVTKNGKLTVYQIFSDNITLGKVSKMSNAQVIKLGKKQDKDYFKDATDEIKNAHNKVTYNGLMDDLSGDDQQEFRDKIVGGSTASLPKNITYRNVEDNSISLYMGKLTGAQKEEMEASNASELRDAVNHKFSFPKKITQRRYEAELVNAKNAKYLEPKAQSVKIAAKTDPSGNKVVSQKISYKSIDMFDEHKYDETYAKAALQNPQALKLFKTAQRLYDSKQEDVNGDVDKEGNRLLSIFTYNYFKEATKDVVHPHTFDDSIVLTDPTSQQIYNKRMIGYKIDGGDSYLLTLAQSKRQTTTLEK